MLLFSSKLQPENGQEILSAKAVLRIWLSRYFSGSGSASRPFRIRIQFNSRPCCCNKNVEKLIVEANFGSTPNLHKKRTFRLRVTSPALQRDCCFSKSFKECCTFFKLTYTMFEKLHFLIFPSLGIFWPALIRNPNPDAGPLPHGPKWIRIQSGFETPSKRKQFCFNIKTCKLLRSSYIECTPTVKFV